MQIIDTIGCGPPGNSTTDVPCSSGSSPDPAAYIIAGILIGVAVDVVLVLAEKAYQVVQSYLTQKENK